MDYLGEPEQIGDDVLIHNIEEDGATPHELTEVKLPKKLHRITEPSDILNDTTFIVYSSSIMELVQAEVPKQCSLCKDMYTIIQEHVGTALVLTWVRVSMLDFSQ